VLIQEPGAQSPKDVEGLDWSRFPVVEMAEARFLKAKKNVKENRPERSAARPVMSRAGGIGSAAPLCRKSDGARPEMPRWIATRSPMCMYVLAEADRPNQKGLSQRGHHARIPARSREAERIRGWAETAQTSWPSTGSP